MCAFNVFTSMSAPMARSRHTTARSRQRSRSASSEAISSDVEGASSVVDARSVVVTGSGRVGTIVPGDVAPSGGSAVVLLRRFAQDVGDQVGRVEPVGLEREPLAGVVHDLAEGSEEPVEICITGLVAGGQRHPGGALGKVSRGRRSARGRDGHGGCPGGRGHDRREWVERIRVHGRDLDGRGFVGRDIRRGAIGMDTRNRRLRLDCGRALAT